MNAADLLVAQLRAEGVRHVFGVPGAHLMPLFHAMHRSGGAVRPIIAKHEEGAAFMADGYARVSGALGVCCGTAGPGTTNLITGVATAYTDSIPMLALTAQVATRSFGRGALQECSSEDRSFSSAEFLKHVTKYSVMVMSEENLGFILRRAIRYALTPRCGPVHLNLPPDVMRREIAAPESAVPAYRTPSTHFDRGMVKAAAAAIVRARRPVMILGTGSNLSGAAAEAAALAEALVIPVATTPKAKGAIPGDHPLHAGVFGIAGARAARETVTGAWGADLLLTVGMSFDEWGTNGWDPELKGDKILVQVDVDPAQIGKNYPANHGLAGDARTVLRELFFEIQREIRRTGHTLDRSVAEFLRFKEEHPLLDDPAAARSDAVPVKPQRLLAEVRAAAPRDTVFFVDSGNHTAWTVHCLDILEPGTFHLSLGFSSMGHGAAAAIGGKLAAPGRPVVAICGDGSLFMNGMEIATAVNYGVPVVWVVFNDSRLNMIYQGESLQGMPGVSDYEFRDTDFAAIARALGAEGYAVGRPGEVGPALDAALACGRPALVDVRIDRDELSPIKDRILSIRRHMGA